MRLNLCIAASHLAHCRRAGPAPGPRSEDRPIRPSASGRRKGRSCSSTGIARRVGQEDGKTPAAWPVAAGILTVGGGRTIMTDEDVRRLPAPPRIQRALHARREGAGPRQ